MLGKARWVRIGLSSIALHLAILSTLAFLPIKAGQTNQLVYLDEIKTAGRTTVVQAENSPRQDPHQYIDTKSGATSASVFDGANRVGRSDKLAKLHQKISKALNDNLREMNFTVHELLLELNFSAKGDLTSETLLRSSGQRTLDEEIEKIVRELQFEEDEQLSNVRVQIPIRIY